MKKLLALLFSIALATTLFAQTTGSIAGIVTDSATGAPIRGAMITACASNMCGGRAITDSTGTYTILNLAAGNYIVVAHARMYRSQRYPDTVAVVTGQTTPNINFVLTGYTPPPPPNPGSISGVVTDSATGLPIAGANVMARDRRIVRRAITGTDGSYTITNLRAGAYRVMANKQGYQPNMYPDPVILAVGQAVTGINFALVQGQVPPPPGTGSISGTVINVGTQQPIANATVHAWRQNICGGMARTGPDGTYTIPNLLSGNYQMSASAMGFMPQTYPDPVTVVENQNTPNINFALQPRQP
jgi:uncharacterized protein (DUF2141 family)